MAGNILSEAGIYAIRSKQCGSMYVGSSDNMRRRLMAHKRLLERGKHHSIKLQRAWSKNGADAFEFVVIERVSDESALIAREQHHIDALGAFGMRGYNMLPMAGSSKGSVRPPMSDKQRAQISAQMQGFRHTEESRRRISEAKKGRPVGPEVIARLIAANTGRKLTPEAIAKRSAKLTGRKYGPMSDERKARISAAKKGKGWTEESRERRTMAGLVKPVIFNGKRYASQTEAAAALGRSVHWVVLRIKSGEAVYAQE